MAAKKRRKTGPRNPRRWFNNTLDTLESMDPIWSEAALTHLLARQLVESVTTLTSEAERRALFRFAHLYAGGMASPANRQNDEFELVASSFETCAMAALHSGSDDGFPFDLSQLEWFAAYWWRECPGILLASRCTGEEVRKLLGGRRPTR